MYGQPLMPSMQWPEKQRKRKAFDLLTTTEQPTRATRDTKARFRFKGNH